MRRWLWVVGIVLAVVLTAYIGAARQTGGPPLDPDSTSPDGAKAVVELVGRLGGDMDVVEGAPDTSVDVALLLEDRYPREQAGDVEAWVRGGGTLVVADVRSLFTPSTAPGSVETVRGGCPLGALEGVGTLEVGEGRGYQVPSGSTGCFGDGSGSYLVSTPMGDGEVVALGGPDAFTNQYLDEADNAVLAGALLAGEGTRTAFLQPAFVGGGDDDLVDLVKTPVRAALAQLAVVFVVVVVWRARRLGRPVEEHQPTQIQGAELTNAVGRLLQSNRRPDRAAAILRDHARRDLSGPLGLPLDASVDVVEATLTARTSLDHVEVRRAVSDPVSTDDALVEVAHLLSRIREELTHDRSITRPS
ncbi:MAG: DUF4350 domain-containing protein [Acidimicrobiales bacterium]|nr:DUF4350 domain-containing protein [Acidimicrobiales bacterium]